MLLAIPGHFTDGVFMGLFYGISKEFHYKKKNAYMFLTLLATCFVPICLHGFYDFCLSMGSIFMLIFIPFIIMIDIVSLVLIVISIKMDKMLKNPNLNNSLYKNININNYQNNNLTESTKFPPPL